MKKIICSVLIITVLCLTGCAGTEPEVVNLRVNEKGEVVDGFSPEEQAGFEGTSVEAPANGAAASAEAPESAAPEAEPLHTVSPLDAYDMYGYVHFLCEKTGTYRFEVVGDQELQWQVYILDSEFPDAERYIPQIYELALEGNGKLSVNEGEYIYMYCNANSWTCLEAPENSSYNCYISE